MRFERPKGLLLGVSIVILVSFLELFVSSQLSNAQGNKHKSRNFVDASSNNFPPMNALDKDGNLTGFGRDLADAVVKAIDGKVTHIHSGHWVQVLQWLDSGKADFIHDTGYTKDRDEFLDYSDPIIEMPEVIFVRPDQYDIRGLNSLKGKTVACVNKYITHLYLQEFPEISCYVVKTPVEGLYELVAGKVDAFVYPEQIVLYLAQNLRLRDKIKISGEPLRTLTWSMVVKEGNKEVLQLLNEGIAKVRQSGKYKRIYNKWWGKKILAGYSKRELQVITVVTTGTSLVVILSISLLLFNRILLRRKKDLEAEIIERKRAEEAKEHLYLMLRSIRNVNQLIVKEKNRDRLLKSICDNFIKTRGCSAAWVALLDESGRLITVIAESGWGKDFLPMVRRLKQGELPDCGQRALRQSAVVVTEESAPACTGCPLAKGGCNRGAMTTRLEHSGKVYGLLSTNLPARFLAEPEECSLFDEVAGDIAFALHGMELEQEHKQAEEELEKHREHLEEMVKARTAELTNANQQLKEEIDQRKRAEEALRERTTELQTIVNSMAGREVRMAELKEAIRKLRVQLEEEGLTPVADDPLIEAGGVENDF